MKSFSLTYSYIFLKVQPKGTVALAVAFLNIAAVLMLGGRTDRPCFKISAQVSENTPCSINKNLKIANHFYLIALTPLDKFFTIKREALKIGSSVKYAALTNHSAESK